MNTIPSESDSNAILDRLLSGAGLHRDAQLAALLGRFAAGRQPGPAKTEDSGRMGGQSLATVWPVDGLADVREGRRIHSCSFPCSGCFINFPGVDACGRGGSGSRPVVHPSSGGEPFRRSGKPANRSRCTGLFCLSFRLAVAEGQPDKMVLMKVYGDSMEPEICHGDMALIDQSKQQIYPHTIYAVGVNEEIYIKQIETLPGHRMLLRSLNERYEPIEVDLRGDMAESVRIIGKVIWWCREA